MNEEQRRDRSDEIEYKQKDFQILNCDSSHTSVRYRRISIAFFFLRRFQFHFPFITTFSLLYFVLLCFTFLVCSFVLFLFSAYTSSRFEFRLISLVNYLQLFFYFFVVNKFSIGLSFFLIYLIYFPPNFCLLYSIFAEKKLENLFVAFLISILSSQRIYRNFQKSQQI